MGNSTLAEDEFFARTAQTFQLAATDDMVPRHTSTLGGGLSVTTYQLVANGVPVEHAYYDVLDRDGLVIAGSGQIAPGMKVSATPTLDAEQAAAIALPDGPSYLWLVMPGAVRPKGTLVLYSPDFGASTPFRLAYRFAYTTTDPQESWRVYISADDGSMLDRWRTDLGWGSGDVAATGTRLDGTSVKFLTTHWSAQYRLYEEDTFPIHTFDGGDGLGSAADEFLDDDNAWNETAVRRGVSAHWAGEQVWKYLVARDFTALDPGRHTLKLLSMDATQPCARTNAINDDGEPKDFVVSLCRHDVDVEVVAHEAGHVMTLSYGDYEVNPETSAILEGLGDIFATSVNHFAGAPDSDWVLYDHTGSPAAEWRDLANPKAHLQPDTYGGVYWLSEMQKPEPDPHVLAGVPAHWFYLLARGGTGINDAGASYDVTGVGRTAAEKIVLATMVSPGDLGSRPKLTDLRRITIERAGTIFGDSSQEALSTAAAWDAVNVLDPNAPADVWHVPEAGAEGVDAWPTTFSFRTPDCTDARCMNGEWQIEIAEDASFTVGVRDTTVTSQSNSGGQVTSSGALVLRPSTVYYWRVRQKYSSGPITWGAWRFTSSFLTGRQQPRGCMPNYGTSPVKPWPATFSWSPVVGATGYELQVARDAAFTDLLVPTLQVPATSFDMQLPVHADVYWRVRSLGPSSQHGDWSTRYDVGGYSAPQEETPWQAKYAIHIETSDPVPGAPYYPANGETKQPFLVDLIATPNGGTGLEFQYSTNAIDCPHETGTLEKATAPYAIEIAVQENTQVNWCVREHGYFGDVTSWSPVHWFAVGDGGPDLISPVNTTVAPWPVNHQWKPLAGVDYYELQIGYDAGFTSLMFDQKIMVTQWSINSPANLQWTDRYWRVRAVHGAQVTAWSSATFNIDPNATIPVQVSPSAGDLFTDPSVHFTWQPVPGATSYRVEVTDNGTLRTTNSAVTQADMYLPSSETLRWQVRAFSTEGYAGISSPSRGFIVREPNKTTPTDCGEYYWDAVNSNTDFAVPLPLSVYQGHWFSIELTPLDPIQMWTYVMKTHSPYFMYDGSYFWEPPGTKYGVYKLISGASDFTISVGLICPWGQCTSKMKTVVKCW